MSEICHLTILIIKGLNLVVVLEDESICSRVVQWGGSGDG